MTLHRARVDVTLRLFVVPLLIAREPDLAFAAPPARERAIDVVLGQRAIRVDVLQTRGIGGDGGRVRSLLLG